MNYTRNPIGAALPFDLEVIKAYLRIDSDDENALISAMGSTAAQEIEAYCDLALLSQTITCTTSNQWPGCDVALPVGPVADNLSVTVAVIEADGTTTAIASGFWLEGGRYPVVHFTTTPGGRLHITYQAGYGADHTALPADLSLAITDQSTRYFDGRGDDEAQGLTLTAARICARYRRVKA